MHNLEKLPEIGPGVFCWDYLDCPKSVRDECPAFKDKIENCWDHDGTRCSKIIDYPINCEQCRYYRAKMLERST